MTTTTITVLVVCVLFPVLLLWNLVRHCVPMTESRHTKIQRARQNGQTWKTIANRYGVSQSTARRWMTA